MQEKHYWGLTPEGFHKIAYREYGKSGNPVLVAVHGLTRNCHDFHFLAEHLQDSFHIISIDMIGRGNSDYLKAVYYNYPQYISDLTGLLARIGVDEVFWIGTSMGGLLGMIMASLKNTPIKKLILNDVGPIVPSTVIERLLSYAGVQLLAPTRLLMEEKAREIYENFGPIDDDNWADVMNHNIRQLPDGAFTLAYDPMVTSQFGDAPQNKAYEDADGNLTVWSYWEKISCPIYVIHGEQSDLLTSSILNRMSQDGPKFEYYGVKDAGHAPWLIKPGICQQIRTWLES